MCIERSSDKDETKTVSFGYFDWAVGFSLFGICLW